MEYRPTRKIDTSGGIKTHEVEYRPTRKIDPSGVSHGRNLRKRHGTD